MKHTHAEGLRHEFRSRSADRDAWQGDTRREVPDGDEVDWVLYYTQSGK